MFGRKNGDDYDDYNERNAAKYDDDYIAPSHDYRRECDHSHEQTYEDMDDLWECRHSHEQSYQNINEVRECNHSHEQTYADADTEQRPYDNYNYNYNSIESMFEAYLEPNEHLLWAGGSGDPAKQNQESMKKDSSPGLTLLIIGIVLMFTCFAAFIGLAFIAAGVVLLVMNIDHGFYAVTDKRLMKYIYGQFESAGLQNIISTNASMSGNNTGKLTINLRGMLDPAERTSDNRAVGAGRTLIVMKNIQDPVRVKQIIDDACAGVRYMNYQNQGKGY